MRNQELVIAAIKGLFALLALLATALFVVRPMLRHLFHPVDTSFLNPTLHTPTEGEELEIPAGPAPKKDRHAMLDDLRRNPRETAARLRQWIKER